MTKKYEITDLQHPKKLNLFRIRALRDFGDVKTGDLGGFIEHEGNLSITNTCWVYGDAQVSGNVKVKGKARIDGDVEVFDDVKIKGKVHLTGNVRIHGKAEITDSYYEVLKNV